jgi:hypothetical protein
VVKLKDLEITDAEIQQAIAMKARAGKEADAELVRAAMQLHIAAKLGEAAAALTPDDSSPARRRAAGPRLAGKLYGGQRGGTLQSAVQRVVHPTVIPPATSLRSCCSSLRRRRVSRWSRILWRVEIFFTVFSFCKKHN